MNVWWATSETVFQHIYLYWCFHFPEFISNLPLSYSAEADSGWALRQGIENMWLLRGAWSSSQHGDSSWLDLHGGLGLHNASPSWQSGNCALCTFVATGLGVLYCGSQSCLCFKITWRDFFKKNLHLFPGPHFQSVCVPRFEVGLLSDFWTQCEKEKVLWFERIALKHTYILPYVK